MASDLSNVMLRAEKALSESGQLLRIAQMGVGYSALFKTLRTYLPMETSDALHTVAVSILKNDSYRSSLPATDGVADGLPSLDETVGTVSSSGEEKVSDESIDDLSDDDFRKYIKQASRGVLTDKEVEALVLSRRTQQPTEDISSPSVIERTDEEIATDEENAQPPFIREAFRRAQEGGE